MITRRTVMVLGAGASAPYGLPLGARLRELILGMSAKEVALLPVGAGVKRESWVPHHFLDAFKRSQSYSIDSFLSHRPEFQDIGKQAIARTLLPLESIENLHAIDLDDHWYRYLAHAMDTSWERFCENDIAFVTFNYDRSLEVFLIDMMRHRFNKSEDEAHAMLSRFPIVHVYGSLGSVDPRASNFVPYGGGDDVDRSAWLAASGLRIIGEDRDGCEEFSKAKELISKAAALCFLGFAFDPVNVERLGGRTIGAGWRPSTDGGSGRVLAFAASTYGFKDAEQQVAYGRISTPQSPIDMSGRMMSLKSLDLLRSSQILQTA